MELPYRVLRQKLSEHPLVSKVTSNYFNIMVTWKSGIKEKWAINRKERMGRSIYKSSIAPIVIPISKWWEDLSNDKKLVKSYKFGINELEHDVTKYPNFTRWSWSEFVKLGFYEQRIFVHEFLQFVLDNGWNNNQYSENVLNHSLQLVFDEQLKTYSYGRGWKLGRRYAKEKPGHRLIDHYIPLDRYGKHSYSGFLDRRTKFHVTLLYRGIVNLIRYNRSLIKKGEKPKYLYFDYDSLLANLRFHREKAMVAKIRPISLYRSIIKEFGMSGKSMYDFDPLYGEKSIAAFAEECPYYYRPTCPFDMGANGLAKFLGTSFAEDHGGRYDFTIIDFNFKFKPDLFKIVMETVYPKVDSMIMFVDNFNIEEIIAKYKPRKSIPMRVSRFNMINGAFLLI